MSPLCIVVQGYSKPILHLSYFYLQEIVGGMLDLEPRLWRKPWKESFEDQRKKVLQFAESWKAYDWTQNLDETD